MTRQRAYLMITVFALLLVLFPFLFWYNTWFGRKLTDTQITDYLADPAKPGGCFIVNATAACGTGDLPSSVETAVHQAHASTSEAIRQRLARAERLGQLPAGTPLDTPTRTEMRHILADDQAAALAPSGPLHTRMAPPPPADLVPPGPRPTDQAQPAAAAGVSCWRACATGR